MTPDADDLVILVPDKSYEAALHGLLGRTEAMGIRPIRYRILVHPDRDPGCLLRGHELLRPYVRGYSHALVLFDLGGSGAENESQEAVVASVTGRLAASGWEDRACAVVVSPELDIWIWSGSPHVSTSLWWSGQQKLREWLADRGLWASDRPKPARPKEALLTVLRHVKHPYSSAIYREVASRVSLNRCTDAAFRRLQAVLQEWFGLV